MIFIISLDTVEDEILENGTLKDVDAQGRTLWQQYIPKDRELLSGDTAKHVGLHTIVFEGRPDVTLADKLVLMRYRHKDESSWNLVPLNEPVATSVWQSGTPAPFQWAGAAGRSQAKSR